MGKISGTHEKHLDYIAFPIISLGMWQCLKLGTGLRNKPHTHTHFFYWWGSSSVCWAPFILNQDRKSSPTFNSEACTFFFPFFLTTLQLTCYITLSFTADHIQDNILMQLNSFLSMGRRDMHINAEISKASALAAEPSVCWTIRNAGVSLGT